MMRMMMVAASVAAMAAEARAADPAGLARAPIDKFVAAFSKGDLVAAKSAYVASPTIIDEPPPYFWSGKNAFDTWLTDLGNDSKAAGRTQEKLVIGRSIRAETRGNAAYVIAPATYSFVKSGAAMVEPGQMTFVLTKQAAGWKIESWTWTGPRARLAKPAK